ncbi:hypothetical protein Tco_0886060 [Tanacetum coccineum]
MAIFAILISSDSSKESVGTSTSWVILFGKIPTSIPATVPIIDLPVVHDDTPLTPIETPTIPPVVSTLPYTSPFLYTDSSDSDILRDHHHRTRMRLLFLGGGAEKRVRALPSGRLASRYPPDHSSSDHFSSDDSSSDSSSDSPSGYSSDTSSGHSIPDSSFDTPVLLELFKESYEAYIELNIDSDVQADIDVDIAAAKAATAREADDRVEVGIGSDGEDEA